VCVCVCVCVCACVCECVCVCVCVCHLAAGGGEGLGDVTVVDCIGPMNLMITMTPSASSISFLLFIKFQCIANIVYALWQYNLRMV
jgi:hypothetical protein